MNKLSSRGPEDCGDLWRSAGLLLSWDQELVPITPSEAEDRLQRGHPSIEIGGGSDSLIMATWMMRPGEVKVVAHRIREVLGEASA